MIWHGAQWFKIWGCFVRIAAAAQRWLRIIAATYRWVVCTSSKPYILLYLVWPCDDVSIEGIKKVTTTSKALSPNVSQSAAVQLAGGAKHHNKSVWLFTSLCCLVLLEYTFLHDKGCKKLPPCHDTLCAPLWPLGKLEMEYGNLLKGPPIESITSAKSFSKVLAQKLTQFLLGI